jgi:hypothetical protein
LDRGVSTLGGTHRTHRFDPFTQGGQHDPTGAMLPPSGLTNSLQVHSCRRKLKMPFSGASDAVYDGPGL